MRGDMPLAAVRLSSELPSRRHEQQFPTNMKDAGRTEPRAHTRDYSRASRNARPVEVNGVRYPTMEAARKALGIGKHAIARWVDSGKARRV